MKKTFRAHRLLNVLAAGVSILALASSAGAADKSPFGGTVRDEVGVNIHFTDPQPGEMEMLSAAGFGAIRMDFVWDATEKTAGVTISAPMTA